MAKGRKPLPNNVHHLHGNRSKKKLNDKEPKPKRVKPVMPKFDTKTQEEIWSACVDATWGMGVLTQPDGLALRQLVEAIYDFRKAQDILKHYGSTTYEVPHSTRDDVILVKVHPAQGIKERADGRIRAWMSEFGLTPSARSRIVSELDGDEDDGDGFFTNEG